MDNHWEPVLDYAEDPARKLDVFTRASLSNADGTPLYDGIPPFQCVVTCTSGKQIGLACESLQLVRTLLRELSPCEMTLCVGPGEDGAAMQAIVHARDTLRIVQ